MNVVALGVVLGGARALRLKTVPLGAAALLAAAAIGSAAAQEVATAPITAAAIVAAPAPTIDLDDGKRYRSIGARHLYDAYRQRIFQGQLPPLLYAIAIIDVEIDADGRVVSALVMREPAVAKEVVPWILGLIQAASPFPKPGHAGHLRYRDIWLVDHSYTFQLDSLTEGQR